jgi:hypothetical protein
MSSITQTILLMVAGLVFGGCLGMLLRNRRRGRAGEGEEESGG